jgi:hypothetical protein
VMAGIPAVTSKDSDGNDICWPWAGLFDIDPVEKLAADLGVLPSAAQYFMRESSRAYSFRGRFAHENAVLHLIWEIRRQRSMNSTLSKVRALLRINDEDHAFNLVRGFDDLKITYGFIKRNPSDWVAIRRIAETIDFIASDNKRMLSCVLDISR